MSYTHLAETFCLSQNLDSLTLNHGKILSICCEGKHLMKSTHHLTHKESTQIKAARALDECVVIP